MLAAFTDALKGAGRAMAGIYGEVVGTYRAIATMWTTFPPCSRRCSPARPTPPIEKLEQFINSSIGGINNASISAHQRRARDQPVRPDRLPRYGASRPISASRSAMCAASSRARSIQRDRRSAGPHQRLHRRRRPLCHGSAQLAATRAGRRHHRDRSRQGGEGARERAKAANDEADALKKLHDVAEAWLTIDAFDPSELTKDRDGIPDIKRLCSATFPTSARRCWRPAPDFRPSAGDGAVDVIAFGKVGNVFGGMIADLASYQEARAQLAIDVIRGDKTQEQADRACRLCGPATPPPLCPASSRSSRSTRPATRS
jgi:hypothetical protein